MNVANPTRHRHPGRQLRQARACVKRRERSDRDTPVCTSSSNDGRLRERIEYYYKLPLPLTLSLTH